jgi:hypothetical protein
VEIGLERKLREIRAEDRKFIVRLISAVTLAFSAAFAVGSRLAGLLAHR